MQVYPNFEMLKENLKYALLSAYRNNKKSASFSSVLANAMGYYENIAACRTENNY